MGLRSRQSSTQPRIIFLLNSRPVFSVGLDAQAAGFHTSPQVGQQAFSQISTSNEPTIFQATLGTNRQPSNPPHHSRGFKEKHLDELGNAAFKRPQLVSKASSPPDDTAAMDIPTAVKTLKRLAVYPKRRDPQYIDYHYRSIRPALLAAANADINVVQLTQLWYMLAKLKRSDKELVGKLMAATERKLHALDPYGSSSILWSLFILSKADRGEQLGSSSSAQTQQGVKHLALALQAKFVERLEDANAQDCSNFVVASGKLGLGDPKIILPVTRYYLHQVTDTRAQNASSILHAHATMPQACLTPQDAIALVARFEQNVANVTFEVADFMYAVAALKLRLDPSQMWSILQKQIDVLNDLPTTAAARLLYALGKQYATWAPTCAQPDVGFTRKERVARERAHVELVLGCSQLQIALLLRRFVDNRSVAGPQDVANVLWSLCTMRQVHAVEHWEAVLERAVELLPQCEGQHIAQICLAVGWFAEYNADLPAQLCCALLSGVLTELSTRGAVEWADVTAAAWACAKVRYFAPDELSSVLDRQDIRGPIADSNLSQLLAACATLPLMHPKALSLLEKVVTGNWKAGGTSPRVWATGLWAAAILGWGGAGDWEKVAGTLNAAINKWGGVRKLGSKDCHTLLHASKCVRLKHGVQLLSGKQLEQLTREWGQDVSRGTHVSYLQSQVADQLRMCYPNACVELEAHVASGLPTVDILLTWPQPQTASKPLPQWSTATEIGGDGDGTLLLQSTSSVQMAASSKGGFRVAVELHGPSHFFINVPRELHVSKVRRWMTEASGCPVVVIVVAEWTGLGSNAEAQQAYLTQKIAQVAPAPQFDLAQK